MKPKKATKRPAVRMKPAMKAMKSMRMKPGDRAGNKYCRLVDGKVVEHKGGRHAPGSCRTRNYISKNAQIKTLQDEVAAYVQKTAPLEKELDSKRAQVDVLTAAVEELTAKTAPLEKELDSKRDEVDELTGAVDELTATIWELRRRGTKKKAIPTDPTEEFEKGRTFEWKRWKNFIDAGDVVIEIQGMPRDPNDKDCDNPLTSLKLVSSPPFLDL